MDEARKKQCKNVGLHHSLIFATLGLVSAFLPITLIVGFERMIIKLLVILPSILVAISALYITAAVLGMIAGILICQFKEQNARINLIGILLAESCLLVSVLAGSSVEFFANLNSPRVFEAYIFRPVFWVMFIGSIPALVLGIYYARKVKRISAANQ